METDMKKIMKAPVILCFGITFLAMNLAKLSFFLLTQVCVTMTASTLCTGLVPMAKAVSVRLVEVGMPRVRV